MKPFTYERAGDAPRPRMAAAATPGAQVHRRRHQPARPDEAARSRRRRTWSTSTACRSPASRTPPTAACASARWCATADLAADAARAHALSGAGQALAGRRLGPAAQQGDHRRQPAAAHPLLLLLRPAQALQQARSPAPAARPSAASTASTPILGASDACIATHPSDMAVAMRALDAQVETLQPGGGAPRDPDRRLPPPARRHAAASRPTWTPGELITAVILPPPPPGGQVYRKVRDRASYAFALVSVAAIVDARGRQHPRRAAGVRRRGAQALARRRRRARAGRRSRARQPRSTPRPTRVLQGARGHGHNDFKIPLTRRVLAGVLSEAARDLRRTHDGDDRTGRRRTRSTRTATASSASRSTASTAPLKVTGRAPYAYEVQEAPAPPPTASSSRPRSPRAASRRSTPRAAEAAPGVLLVLDATRTRRRRRRYSHGRQAALRARRCRP